MSAYVQPTNMFVQQLDIILHPLRMSIVPQTGRRWLRPERREKNEGHSRSFKVIQGLLLCVSITLVMILVKLWREIRCESIRIRMRIRIYWQVFAKWKTSKIYINIETETFESGTLNKSSVTCKVCRCSWGWHLSSGEIWRTSWGRKRFLNLLVLVNRVLNGVRGPQRWYRPGSWLWTCDGPSDRLCRQSSRSLFLSVPVQSVGGLISWPLCLLWECVCQIYWTWAPMMSLKITLCSTAFLPGSVINTFAVIFLHSCTSSCFLHNMLVYSGHVLLWFYV